MHEYAHACAAVRCGDPTPHEQGRITLNPFKHIDPLGVLVFMIMRIGWAKPVQVEPKNFANPVRDLMLVSFAGPGINLFVAIASGFFLEICGLLQGHIPAFYFMTVTAMLKASVWINIMLGVLNLLPIPPLDGSKIIVFFLPPHAAEAYNQAEPYGLLFLFLLFYTDVISRLILPIIAFADKLL